MLLRLSVVLVKWSSVSCLSLRRLSHGDLLCRSRRSSAWIGQKKKRGSLDVEGIPPPPWANHIIGLLGLSSGCPGDSWGVCVVGPPGAPRLLLGDPPPGDPCGGVPLVVSLCTSAVLHFLYGACIHATSFGLQKKMTNAIGLSQIGWQEAELRAFLGRLG